MSTPSRVLTASRTLTAVKGKALYHDGIDDYVSIPDDPSLDITSEITIEALIYLREVAEFQIIVSKFRWANPSDNEGYAFRITDIGKLHFRLYHDGYSDIYSPSALPLNTWQHLVGVFDGSNQYLYLNGEKIRGPESASAPLSNTENLFIGSEKGTTRFFNGTIALVRIYERALSAAEVLYNKEHPYNPILHGCVLWLGHDSIDEGAGIWRDKSGYNNDGVVYGATAVEMNKLAGRVLTV